jgi:formylglycine-generating enzyme required for sulfatase activity
MLDKTEVPIWQYVAFLNAIEQDNRGSALAHHHSLQPITWEDGEFVADTTLQNLPINYVSFYDALTFCTWRGSSLPTEAMWERAAKGADRENPRNFPWTEGRATCQNSVFYTNATLCAEHPQEVGTHLLGATPEGVLDMAGNVSEWVWDWYDRYAETTVTDPKGPDTGKYKILRGGGFRETSDALRVTDRVSANPLSRSEGIGFRCGHEEQP